MAFRIPCQNWSTVIDTTTALFFLFAFVWLLGLTALVGNLITEDKNNKEDIDYLFDFVDALGEEDADLD